jgi:hypothetical protein
VKNRFQSLPFKCNLQRYIVRKGSDLDFIREVLGPEAGRCTFHQVDP